MVQIFYTISPVAFVPNKTDTLFINYNCCYSLGQTLNDRATLLLRSRSRAIVAQFRLSNNLIINVLILYLKGIIKLYIKSEQDLYFLTTEEELRGQLITTNWNWKEKLLEGNALPLVNVIISKKIVAKVILSNILKVPRKVQSSFNATSDPSWSSEMKMRWSEMVSWVRVWQFQSQYSSQFKSS